MIHKISSDFNYKFKDNRLIFLSNFKNFNLELKNYFGINRGHIFRVLNLFGFSLRGFKTEPSLFIVKSIEKYLRKNSFFGDKYKRILVNQKDRYKNIGTYRGFRFKFKLPANGQRTRVNSRTSRKLISIFIGSRFTKDINQLEIYYFKKTSEINKRIYENNT